MNYITPKELAVKLYRKNPFWFQGKPRVHVVGTQKTFGVIRFSFPDTEVIINVYLYDKQAIKDIANKCIADFGSYIHEWNMERLS